MEHLSVHRILKRPKAPLRGFTLIEMLVVLVIIVIISAIIFSGQLNFDRTINLNNTAYDLALSIKQSQTYGLSSRSFSGTRNVGYGTDFQSAQTAAYVFFADTSPAPSGVGCHATTNPGAPDAKPGNCEYDGGAEMVQTYNLNNGYSIANFCVYSTGTGRVCTGAGGLTQLDITFVRPNSETTIYGKTGSWNAYTSACIKLSSRAGDYRYVSVSRTGQIQAGQQSIDSTTCN